MVRTCFVPNCNTGNKTCNEKVSTFSVPKDVELLEKWKKTIRRLDRELQQTDCVCEKHFDSRFIIKHHEIDYGSHVEKIPLRKARLHSEAIPTIFPNYPKLARKRLAVRKRSGRIPVVSPTKATSSQNSDLMETEPLTEVGTLHDNSGNCSEEINFCFDDIWDHVADIVLPDVSWAVHKIGDDGKRTIIFSEYVRFQSDIPIVRKQIWLDVSTFPFVHFSVYNQRIAANFFETNIISVQDVENYIKRCHVMKICVGGPKVTDFESAALPKNAILDTSCGVLRHVDCNAILDEDCEDSSCDKCCNLNQLLFRRIARQKKKSECMRTSSIHKGTTKVSLSKKTRSQTQKKMVKDCTSLRKDKPKRKAPR